MVNLEILNNQHDRTKFDCGNWELNRFIRELAGQYQRKNLATVYILVENALAKDVIGFFTLSAASHRANSLPPALLKNIPAAIPIPSVLLGRLAIDKRYQKLGLGEALLSEALRITQSLPIGFVGVAVEAKDEAAVRFYQRFGFLPFPDLPDKLIVSRNEIKKLIM